MRLIDADALKECFSDDTFKNRMVKVIIDRQPTIDPEKTCTYSGKKVTEACANCGRFLDGTYYRPCEEEYDNV